MSDDIKDPEYIGILLSGITNAFKKWDLEDFERKYNATGAKYSDLKWFHDGRAVILVYENWADASAAAKVHLKNPQDIRTLDAAGDMYKTFPAHSFLQQRVRASNLSLRYACKLDFERQASKAASILGTQATHTKKAGLEAENWRTPMMGPLKPLVDKEDAMKPLVDKEDGAVAEEGVLAVLKGRPVIGLKGCEEYQKDLLKYQEELERALQDADAKRPATFEEIKARKRPGFRSNNRGVPPGWGTGSMRDTNMSAMKPGAVFVAAIHQEYLHSQDSLKTREQFNAHTVVKTDTWSGLIQSKERHLICVRVFKSHCLAVPIFTYGGRGLYEYADPWMIDNTWATHIPIRDVDLWAPKTPPTIVPLSRFGSNVLFCQRMKKDSNGETVARKKFYRMSDNAVVHFAQIITHKSKSRAAVFANLTDLSLQKLLRFINDALGPDYIDRTFGEPPSGPYPDAERYPYNEAYPDQEESERNQDTSSRGFSGHEASTGIESTKPDTQSVLRDAPAAEGAANPWAEPERDTNPPLRGVGGLPSNTHSLKSRQGPPASIGDSFDASQEIEQGLGELEMHDADSPPVIQTRMKRQRGLSDRAGKTSRNVKAVRRSGRISKQALR